MRFRLVFSLLSLLLLTSPALATEVFVSLNNGTAGQDLDLRVTGLQQEELVNFSLVRPDETPINFSLSADSQGILADQIYGLHVREAGDYSLVLSRPALGGLTQPEGFTISPGVVSAYRSEVEVARHSAPADGEARIDLVARLRDAYGNPVPDQPIKLISSRHQDQVLSDLQSDAQGVARGQVQTTEPGVSVFSVLVDGVVLLERPELIWHLPADNLFAVGQSDSGGLGDFLKAQLFDDEFFQDAAYFTIEDLPSEVVVDRNYTFRVEAKDPDGNTVKDYGNRVRFSSSDGQAQLPADYQFEPADQGIHTFALAINFATTGTQTLNVNDLTDGQIAGSIEIEVVDSAGGTPGDNLQNITILTPSEGTYRTSRVTVTGTAPRNTLLRIVDGPTTLIEDLITDSSGEFVYQTPALADGLHKFLVSSMDGSLVSSEVAIRVDQTPPRVLAVELDPSSGIETGTVFQVNVSSNETLSAASCTFNGVTTELSPAGDRFNGTFQAPGVCGEYPMGCTVADVLGNELVEPNAAVVPVCGDTDLGEPIETIAVPDAPVVPPTAVDNLSAEPGERQVTLYWSPAKDDVEVTAYQIDFGLSADALISQNITPDARTQWYVEGLNEATKYYFTVIAIDANGNKGARSQVVEATTFGESAFKSSAVPESGAKLWLPIVLALSFGFFFLGVSLRKKV